MLNQSNLHLLNLISDRFALESAEVRRELCLIDYYVQNSQMKQAILAMAKIRTIREKYLITSSFSNICSETFSNENNQFDYTQLVTLTIDKVKELAKDFKLQMLYQETNINFVIQLLKFGKVGFENIEIKKQGHSILLISDGISLEEKKLKFAEILLSSEDNFSNLRNLHLTASYLLEIIFHCESKDYFAANKCAEELLALSKDSDLTNLCLGFINFQREHYTKAHHHFKKAFGINPQVFSFEFMQMYASCAYKLGKFETTLFIARTMSSQYSENNITYGILVDAYTALNEKAKALLACNKMIELKPETESYVCRGFTYAYFQCYENAIEDLDLALDLAQTIQQSKFVFLRGLIKAEYGYFKEALDDFEKCPILPWFDNKHTSNHSTYSLIKTKQLNKALTILLEESYENTSFEANRFYNIAICYVFQHKFKNALTNLYKAINLDPENQLYCDIKNKLFRVKKKPNSMQKQALINKHFTPKLICQFFPPREQIVVENKLHADVSQKI